ncbi:MAG: carboxypeptidase-like regulatory domain-containing protein, partial [Terracidiphilus sp.]
MKQFLVILLFTLFTIPIGAQNAPETKEAPPSSKNDNRTGVLTGTVTDPDGAFVPGASVSVRNAAGVIYTTTTDGEGRFIFRDALSGEQTVTVTQPGFAESRREGVAIQPGETMDITISLQLEVNKSSVVVAADQVEQIETDNGVVSNRLSESEMHSFPVNGRNPLAFIALAPGVSNQTGQDEIKVGVLGSAKFAVNGGRTEYNSFLVDGNDVLNTDIAASHGHSTLMVYPSIDALKEVKVLTSNYGAEYGRSASGTTLFTLKSGGQTVHGSAYEFIRNEFFNARNYFDQSNKAPLYRRNDFGGSIGGPLFIPHLFNTKKDKTYLFVSEEFRKERSPQQFNQGVPSDAERGYNPFTGTYGAYGDFTDLCPPANGRAPFSAAEYPDFPETNFLSFANNLVPISGVAGVYLQAGLIPRANATTGCISSDDSCYVNTVSPATDYRQDLIRLDQTLPLKSHLSFSGVHDHWTTVVPIPQWTNYINSFPSVENSFQGPGLSAIAHVTTLLSGHTLNDLSYGMTLQRIKLANIPGPGANLSRSALDALVYPNNLGSIFSNNYGKLPSLVFAGNDAAYGGAGFNIDTSFDPWSHSLFTQSIRESVSQIWNRHTLLAGIQIIRAHRTETSAVNGGNTGDVQGALIFNNLLAAFGTRNTFADFLEGGGGVQSYQQDNSQLPYKIHYWTIEPYVQDDWKVTSHLTLNLGFRMSLYYNWEPEGVDLYNWVESSFDPNMLATNGMSIFPTQGYLQYGNNQQGNIINPVPLDPNSNVYSMLYNGLVNCVGAGFSSSCQSTHLLNPAPRVGFAWAPEGQRYSIRGGYGVFFEHGTGSEANAGSLVGDAPYVLSMEQSNPGGYASIGNPTGL